MDEEPDEILEVTAGELLLAALIAKDYVAQSYTDTKARASPDGPRLAGLGGHGVRPWARVDEGQGGSGCCSQGWRKHHDRQAVKPWWDTRFSRAWEMQGLLVWILGRRMAYVGHNRPDNDSWTGN